MKYLFNYFLNKLPMIEVEMVHKNNIISVWALIDTGADYSIFPREVAEELGITVEKGEMIVLDGAGGSIVAYLHPLKVRFCEKEVDIKACFSEKENIPENILGRKDVINNFQLTLSKDWFELEPYSKENEE